MTKVNGHLKERNTRIATSFCLTLDLKKADVLPIILTEKIDRKSRKKPVTLVPTYCPFCGKRYPRAKMFKPKPKSHASTAT